MSVAISTESNTDVAVVVSSCDKYSDLWPPFFFFFNKYWPDCPYPVYLISDALTYQGPDAGSVRPLLVGKGLDFSLALKQALSRIGEHYIILFLEDFLLKRPVDTGAMRDYIAYAGKSDAAYLRLMSNPGPDTVCPDNPNVGEIARGAPYRVSLQAAIWDRRFLMDFLTAGESPWEVEILGSRRSDASDRKMLCVTAAAGGPVQYQQAVNRAKWMSDAVEYCRCEGVPVDLTARPVENAFDRLRHSRALRRLAQPLFILAPFLRGENRYRMKRRLKALRRS